MPGKHEKPKKYVRIRPNSPRARKGGPKREPVAYAALVPVVVTVGAWLGFDLDDKAAAAIIGAVIVVAGIVRQYVTPVADPVVPPSEDVAVTPGGAGVQALLDEKGL